MNTLNHSPNGPYTIRWPDNPAQVIATTQQYIAYETGLSATEQLPNVTPAMLQTVLEEALAASTMAALGDATRGAQAETLQQTYEQAMLLMRKVYAYLYAQHIHNLSNMEFWGFQATVGLHTIKVAKPHKLNDLLHWLEAYIAKETSLPTAERIMDPPLTQMQALLASLQTTLAARNAGRLQRMLNLATRNQHVSELRSLLKLAAKTRMHLSYDGRVTYDLIHWGFVVEARVRPTPPEEEGTPT